MHLSLIDNVEDALNRMKYSINHSYLFQNKLHAMTLPFLQFMLVFLVEICNTLVILTTFDALDIVQNFVAISIISELDKMIYESIGP